jgi:hypothetical protein
MPYNSFGTPSSAAAAAAVISLGAHKCWWGDEQVFAVQKRAACFVAQLRN